MTNLRWQLEVWAVRHGLWLVAGAILLLAALSAWFIWLPAQQTALHHARMALLEARRAPRLQEQALDAPAPLPPAAVAADSVQRLFALARQHGLKVVQAEYRRQDVGRVGRWQVQMPASGSYPQVRYFLRAAQNVPGLSLDEVGLHRSGTGGAVEARLLFSIWYSAGEAR